VSPKAVLIGLPGTGKTSAGRQLAKRLDVPFADSDDLVEQRAGHSVRAIFEQDGEAGFRQAEAEVIGAALTAFDGLRHHTETGDDRTRVLVGSATVDGVAFDETTVLRLGEDGRVTAIALSIRPLPALAAVMRALGGQLLAQRGRPLAGRAVRVALTPLVAFTRLADRLAGAVA
jgi:hypothetical protein